MTFIKHRILSVVLFILFLKVLEYIPRTIEAKRTQNSVSTSNDIREAIDFLSQAEYKVKLSKRHKNVTLVFGYTKEGTTTLVQWLATDGENLSAEAFKRSGESYIIADERKTHTSPDPTTKFPELVVDERNSSIAFYDFPGFNDSQTVKDELAAKYFIQKVINHVEYVKIILVMSQPMNRASSIKLMRQVAHFVKNIGKFRDSIAIVVTKVLNCENKEPDIEINDVAKFLQNTRKILKRPADRQIIQLINILLTNEATKYPRIGIFPQPNENGLLSQSNTWLKPYKESIQEIIQRTLKFTPKEDNFNHLELDKNKSFINDLAKEIIIMINNTINNIANDIKKFYNHSIGKMHQKIQSISDFKHFLDNDKLKQFKITIEQIYQLNNITSIEHIHSIANLSNIPLYNITEQYSYLEFLKPNIKLLKKKIVPEIITDLNGSYNKLLTFIDHKADEIRDQIASRVNDIQKKIREYYESETKILRYQEGVDELNQTINILNSLIVPNTEEPEYISKFLNKTSEIVHKLHIDEDVRKEINHKIVDCKYMKHSLDYLATFKSLKEYLPSTLFSNPFYNTIEHLKYLQKWYENLSSLYNEHEPSSERIEDILVSSLFNLKHNESKRDEFNHLLYLIARKDKKPCSEQGEYIITDYNVQLSDYFRNNDTLECINGDKVKTIKIFAINTITIDVDLHAQDTQLQVSFIAQKWNIIGKRKIILNGAPADNIQPLEVNNCTSSLEGRNGINGKPGLPGKSAGHFIGIGREFINSNSLTISANGGDGSNGQDGGNGCPGENGKPAELRYFVTAPNNNSQTSEQDFLHDMDSHIFHKLENLTNQNIIIYDIIGTKGGEGGNGGNGGKGGKGGYAGNVKIIHLDNDSFIRKFTKNGNNGSGGKGGDGGIGGKDGDNTRIRYMPGKFAIQQCILPSNTTGLNGTEGKNDFNDEDIVQPMLSNLPTIATIVNQYKKYLAESFNNISHKSNSINDFYRKLSTNYDIRQSYNISHKIQEFNNLEDNLHKIARQDLFSQFYQTLLESIESSPFNNTDDKVLLYLRDTISGRINNLKTNKNSILIVDIYEYLSYVITKIKDIQTSQEKNSQFFAIKSYKCDYIKHNILNRIERLKNFTTEITNEIVEINKQIDDKINTLVDEIRNLGEVDEKRIELQQILISKIILQIANITQQALGITKDERKNIVTLMLAAVYNSSESSLFSNQQIYKDIINTIKGNKIRNLNNYLHNIYREMSKYEEFIDIRKTINNTLIQLNTRRNYEKLTLDDILMLENNVTNKLKEYEIKNMWNSTDALNVLKNINRKIQISSVFDIYDKSKQNPNGLDEISKAIADNRSIMRKLEQNVFEIIAILREARADYKKTIDSELLKSSDVSNLRIRHTLRNVRSEIEQLSRSQEYNITSNNLRHYLGKLDEAITTLIIVYDNIEYYKEQEILMNYIATINLQVVSGVEADNVDISEGLRKLENSLNSNFIIDQYKLIMNSLKLWVFPLAREYLKRFTLLSNFKLKINFPNLVSDAIAQIHYIYENINLNRITITDFDKYIFKEEFDSSEGSITRPFYTWNNKEHEEDIFDLLNGKSIQLKANILRSPNKKYAIKFNTIGIRFKSKNTTLQSIINEELKKYYIQIIHSGDSYFRYNGDYYKISSGRNYEIVYSYETDYKGEPKSKNSIYDKIKSGIPLLSPYTTWKVKLIPPEQDSNFDTLSSFKNEIDLELVGKGSYMKENIYDLEVEDYYAEQKIDLSNTLD